MSAVLVRYRVKPGRAEENAELVRAVYAELAALRPPGFRYSTFVLEDRVTFLHLAITEDGHDTPLQQLPAFRRFLAEIAERCEAQPHTTRLPVRVGSYPLL
jgi:hypothetical protein